MSKLAAKNALRYHKDIRTRWKGVKAHVTWSNKSSNINIRGYLIDELTGVQLDELPTIRKTALDKDDVEYVINQVVADLSERYEIFIHSGDEENSENDNGKKQTMIEAAFSDLKRSKDPVAYEWKETTTESYLTFFERNVLKHIYDCEYPEDFTEQDRKNLIDALRDKRKNNGLTIDEDERNDSGVGQRLYQAQRIYDKMRENHPDLPKLIIDNGELSGRIRQNEQYKTIPFSVHVKFRKRVEEEIEKNPKMARGAALMDSGALRSGEASAVTRNMFNDCEWYSTVWVLHQEDKGKITDTVKSDHGYRLVVLDRWGTEVVRRCNELIGEELEVEMAPIIDKNLSSWVRNALEECGCSYEYIEEYNNLVERLGKNTGKKEDFKDVAAHIMRRNRASIWRNICGFTQWELDYLLGHSNFDSRFEKENVKDDKTITRWAIMMKRFDTESRDEIEPGVYQVELVPDESGDVIEFNEYEFVNTSIKPIKLTVKVLAAEMGEDVNIIKVSKADPKITPGSEDTKGIRRNTNLIGILRKVGTNDTTEKESE